MPRRINLVAVQARMERADYRDAAAFRGKIASLMDDVSRTVDLSLPTLVSFPELIGMYLSFLPQYWDILCGEATMEAGVRLVIGKYAETLPEEHRSRGRSIRHVACPRRACPRTARRRACRDGLPRWDAARRIAPHAGAC